MGLSKVRQVAVESVGPSGVIDDPTELRTYSCDGLSGLRALPGLVVLPTETAQVCAVVRACADEGVPFVARGSGTGLSGGAMPSPDGVLIVTSRMRRILEVDPVNRLAVVQPGVTNASVTSAASAFGLYYAPDPSSQVVCSVGGNVAENSGGAHCLKYGFTTHHVLELEVVLPSGEVAILGSPTAEPTGYDLRGVFVGSEGTLGIATRVTVRLLRKPETVATFVADFASVQQAGDAVSSIIAAGIIPAAVEMMDALAIKACEEATGAGYSLDAAAALIVELDGPGVDVSESFLASKAICERSGSTHIREARSPAERDLIWRARKAAFAAAGRLSPAYLVQDGVVPRSSLPEVLVQITSMSAQAGLGVANVFHAGDGNLHPLVLYNPHHEGEAERAEALATAIVELCVAEGGSITGEHGVGVDKACSMPKMFSPEDLRAMARLKSAFDPDGLSNPGKVFPTPRLCGELPGPYLQHPLEAAGVAERW